MNKLFLKNKTFRRVISFVAAAVVTISGFNISPRIIKAHNEDVSFSFDITHNGVTKPSSEVDTIYEGDGVSINVDWYLSDGDKLEGSDDGTYSRVIKLEDSNNLNIPQFSDKPLKFGERTVGHASVEKDSSGKLVLILKLESDPALTDNGEQFLKGENNRVVTGSIEGIVESDGAIETGSPIKVGIAEDDAHIDMKYDDGTPVSSLDAYKSQGELKYEGSTWYQYFTVTATAKYGPVKKVKFVDTWGDIFTSEPVGFSITSVSGCGTVTTSSLVTSTTDTNVTTFTVGSGFDMEKDGSITFTYKMPVNASAFTDGSTISSNTNEIKATYTDNKKVDDKETYPSTTWLTISKPSVTKTLVSGTDAEQKWKITINPGAAAKKAGFDFQTWLASVTDTLPDGLKLKSGDPNDKTNYSKETYPGSGIYEYEYTTEPDGSKDFANLESQVLENNVTVTDTNSGEYKAHAKYTTVGNPTAGGNVAKDFVSFDDATNEITWKVVLTDISNTYTDVYVKDVDGYNKRYDLPSEAGKTWGEHQIDSSKVVLKYTDNSTSTPTQKSVDLTNTSAKMLDGSTDILNTYSMESWGAGLKFTDAFISKIDATKGLELTITSKVKDSDLKNKVYYNKAMLGYTSGTNNVTKDDDATYEKTVFPSNALTKSGEANDDDSTITYTLKVDFNEMEGLINSGSKNLVLTDTLPEGLEYDPAFALTLKDRYIGSGNYIGDVTGGNYKANGDGTYTYAQWFMADPTGTMDDLKFKASDIAVNYAASTRKLTLTLPINTTNYNIVKGYLASIGGDSRFIEISFRAKVSESGKQAFATSATAVNYTNEATGKYGSDSINTEPAICVTPLTPPNLLTKVGVEVAPSESFARNGVRFQIDINPFAVNLSDGNTITGTDEMSGKMTYYLDTIKVYEVKADGSTVLLSMGDGANNYTYKYTNVSGSGEKLEFTLPDEKHLRIEYYGLLNAYAGTATGKEIGTNSENISVTNTFKIAGDNVASGKDTSGYSNNLSATRYKFAARSNKASVYLNKFTTLGGKKCIVSGTKFELYEVTYSGSGALTELTGGETALRTIEVPASGRLTIDNLDYNKVYALKEISGGTATDASGAHKMKERDGYYYFIVPDDTTVLGSLDDKIHVIGSGNFIEFENEEDITTPDNKTITVSKKAIGGAEELEGAEFKLYKKSVYDADSSTATPVTGWTSGKAPKSLVAAATSGTGVDILFDEQYTLVEVTAPAGYKYAENVSFKVSSDGTVTRIGTNGEVSGSNVTMRDEAAGEIYVSKLDVTSNDIVARAKFEVFAWNNLSHTEEGAALEAWTSSATDAHKLDKSKYKLSPDGTNISYYVIKETEIPSGYEAITDSSSNELKRTVFYLDRNGKLVVYKCYTDTPTESDPTDGKSAVGTYSSTDKKVVVSDSTKNDGIVIYNKEKSVNKISISKKEISGGLELAGATMEIYKASDFGGGDEPDGSATVLFSWTTGLSPHKITVGGGTGEIEPNKSYVLYEKIGPKGYEVIEKFVFSLDDSGNLSATLRADVNVSGQDIEVIDSKIKIYIDKHLPGDTQLAGAMMELYVGKDTALMTNRIASWTSSDSAAKEIVSERLLGDGKYGNPAVGTTYTLVERAAPTGYGSVSDVYNMYTFNIDKYGRIVNLKLYADGTNFTSGTPATDNTDVIKVGDYDNTSKVVAGSTSSDGIILYNKKANTTIKLSKKEQYSSAELAGAKLQLYKSDYDGAGAGTKVGHWTTDSTAKTIVVDRSGTPPYDSFNNSDPDISSLTGTLVPGIYWLVEEEAPGGYGYSEAIKFEIDEAGKIMPLETGSTGKLSSDGTILTMEDKLFTFSIFKQDETTSLAVEGAKLKLTDVTGGGSTEIEEFVTTTSPHFVISSKMQAGHDYELTETSTPAGYTAKFTKISFSLDKDGKINPTTLKYTPSGGGADKAYTEDKVVGLNSARDTLIVSNKANSGTIVLSKKAVGSPSELPGATFALTMEWNEAGNTQSAEIARWSSMSLGKQLKVNSSNKVEKNGSGEIVSIPASTPSNGIKYYIQEVNPPSGYDVYVPKVEFEVSLTSSDASITINAGGDPVRAKVDSTGSLDTLTIRDNKIVPPTPDPKPTPTSDEEDVDPEPSGAKVLPDTGGVVGSVALMLLALAMLISGAVLLMPEKKRKRK